MCYLDGMSLSEIATVLDIPVGTVKSRLYHAREKLKRVLTNDPGTGVMRHADAGYDEAISCAKEQGLHLPMLDT